MTAPELEPTMRVVVFGPQEVGDLVSSAVQDRDFHVEAWPDAAALTGEDPVDADAILIDRTLAADPSVVEEWAAKGRFGPAVPLILVVRERPDPAVVQEWLRAGIWDILLIPIDPEILGLRLRNLVGSRRRPLPGRSWIVPSWPYGWATLVQVTGETLALGRRYGRPTLCFGIAVERDDRRPVKDPLRLSRRLGIAVHEWARGGDLVGFSETGVLLVVAPETSPDAGEIMASRLTAVLERWLERWNVRARIKVGGRVADDDPSATATEFLLRAVARVP